MMVHVEHASVTSWAVMTSFWLEDVAHQAVPSSFVLRITQMEPLVFLRIIFTQKTGTWPGSVVIAYMKDHTIIMKNTWKNTSRTLAPKLSKNVIPYQKLYLSIWVPKLEPHKWNKESQLQSWRIKRINSL
jgi:hypothetical protein